MMKNKKYFMEIINQEVERLMNDYYITADIAEKVIVELLYAKEDTDYWDGYEFISKYMFKKCFVPDRIENLAINLELRNIKHRLENEIYT